MANAPYPVQLSRMLRRLPAIAIALACALALPLAAQAFDLQGHRGARGLAPENTLSAFRVALGLGVTTLETDIAITRDGHLVLSHDPRLNPDIVRGPDGRWLTSEGPAIHSMTLDEVRRLDVGTLNPQSRYAAQWPQQRAQSPQPMPTFDELADLVLSHGTPVRLNLETKITPTSGTDTAPPAEYARRVVDAIRARGLVSRVTVQSFDWRTLLEVKRIAPQIETSCLTIQSPGMDTVAAGSDGASPWHAGLRGADHGNSVPRLARAAGCASWSVFWRNLTPAMLVQARDAGLKVLAWTVNDVDTMGRLIDLGVDGLITDYPDRLRGVMKARGMPLP